MRHRLDPLFLSLPRDAAETLAPGTPSFLEWQLFSKFMNAAKL